MVSEDENKVGIKTMADIITSLGFGKLEKEENVRSLSSVQAVEVIDNIIECELQRTN